MFITAETGIVINNTPEAIWDYASDPTNWTASNPDEHFGLTYNSKDNRPATGVEFLQQESVAGVYADLRERFLYVDKPRIAVWTGTAVYRILAGLVRIRIPEGGVVKAERSPAGTRLSHDVYMDFPNSLWGKMLVWVFKNFLKGPQAVYNHTYKELLYFKEQLEKEKTAPKKEEGVVPLSKSA